VFIPVVFILKMKPLNSLCPSLSNPHYFKQCLGQAWRFTQILAWPSIALLVGNYGSAPAIAEGSKELVANGGNRPYTEWRTNPTAGILRRTVLKVYAQSGEVINLGSSAMGVGAGNIKLFSGTANVDSSTPLRDCKVDQPLLTGKGVINTRAKELAGPLSSTNPNGYTPCTYTAPSSGIYQVIFYGPDGAFGATDPGSVNGSIDDPAIDAEQRSTVSMWDITVRSNAAATVNLTGRVFTDYIALIMDANDRYLKSKLYILTNDGYRYLTDLGIGQGIDPNGFIFFANRTGLLNSSNQILYHSGQSLDNNLTSFVGGVQVPLPSNTLYPSYPTFFNPPAATTISGLGYPATATPPTPATNFLFTGGTGGGVDQSSVGVGGTFSFTTNFPAFQVGSYQIIVDTNSDGFYNPSNGDLILGGVAQPGSNSIVWDGKNSNGLALPPRPNNAAYNAIITLKGGEYHFPFLDVENAPSGVKIQMLNPPGSFPVGTSDTTIYFDERNYTTGSPGVNVNLGCNTNNNTVCNGLAGLDSALGAHRFTGGYGDFKAIDSWIYFPGSAVSKSFTIFRTISGKVWNDVDSSAATPPNIINTGNEVGTNAGGLNAVLIGSDNKVIATVPVAADGTYLFTNVLNDQNGLKVRLSTITVTPGSPAPTAPAATLPANWISTSNLTTAAFNIGATTGNIINKDFGIQKAAPNVLLVKRITALNGQQIKNNGTSLNVYENEASYPYDDNNNIIIAPYIQKATDKWPGTNSINNSSTFLRGAATGVTVRPRDELEYTIYFLSAGTANATAVSLCDLVPENQTFVPNAYSNYSSTGVIGDNLGIALSIGNTTATTLTNNNDTDRGRYYPPKESLPDSCKILNVLPNNDYGAVVVNLGTLPKPNGTAADPNGYGYIRFRTKVK
jgi:uncharacterized repeat protein (TIGR01451 family)